MKLKWMAATAALVLVGCSDLSPGPQDLPERVREQRVMELPDGRARFWPRSAPVAKGVTYRMSVYTHCGLDYLLDFDMSFWEVTADPGPDHLEDPEDEGLITLVSDDEAVYTSSTGGEFQLARTEGPRDTHYCD